MWNINVRKEAINDKWQGTVVTYSRCGGIVNNQIKKGLLLSLPVKKNLQSVNIRQSYKQEGEVPTPEVPVMKNVSLILMLSSTVKNVFHLICKVIRGENE